ncbi:hypothetical protein SY85_09170 [Flavisolibacter tropicus]|uniref:Uncharacterized protein n=1 Tax=Flavisolibacter tropicus TaxID=1492898 RepID=A0A172TUJ4_9BACT|nr:hypothetical protein SY85_09170 [Flavisolibacter tropicus]
MKYPPLEKNFPLSTFAVKTCYLSTSKHFKGLTFFSPSFNLLFQRNKISSTFFWNISYACIIDSLNCLYFFLKRSNEAKVFKGLLTP